MKRLGAKLIFIHRRLWRQDGTYRAAILLGPPPLLGFALAAGVWAGVHGLAQRPAGAGPLPWAHPEGPRTLGSAGEPHAEKPVAQLPQGEVNGRLPGLATGWRGTIAPIKVSPALDVNVVSAPLAMFTLDQTAIDVARIMEAGPATGLYVGVETALFAVRTAGIHALSIRVERSSRQSANCLARFAFAGHRLVSNLVANISGPFLRSYDPVQFDLEPGLYRISVAFGCWHGEQVSGPGLLTVLIRHPGEKALAPARPEEILHPLPDP